LTSGSADAIAAVKEGFFEANKQMSESDRLIMSSFNVANENLETGLQRLQKTYGDVSGILAGVSGNIQEEISAASQTAKQAYESGAVESARTLGHGSNEAIKALQQGRTGAIDALRQSSQQQISTSQTGLRDALGLGQPYQQKGTEGLGAFADTALNPDSALFQRNLAKSQEALDSKLASLGLLNSGAAIQAQSELIQDMTAKEMERQTGLQRDLANMGLGQIGQQQGLIADATRSQIGAIAQQAGLRAGLEQSTAQNIANVATQTATNQAQIQSQLGRDLGQLSQMSGDQKVNMLKDMGVIDINYQIQGAQDFAKIDSLLANNALQQGIARGEISQSMANNFMNEGLQTGNILGALSTNLSNLGQASATNQANMETSNQNNLFGLRQEGLRESLASRERNQNNLQALPLQQFGDQYNIGRTNLTNLQNMEMGGANTAAAGLYAGAQRNMQQANNATSNFNDMLSLAGTMGGSSAFKNFGSGLMDSFRQNGFSGAGNFIKGATVGATQMPNTISPAIAPTTQINLPSSGVPANLGNFGVTPFNPTTQEMPSMWNDTPTNNSFFQPPNTLQVEVLPHNYNSSGRNKATLTNGTGIHQNPYSGNQMPHRQSPRGFRQYLGVQR